MQNTVNFASRCLVDLLERHGVNQVFASPGSRNTPLLIALSRSEVIKTQMVVDERVAAFMALGFSTITSKPVAIVCTSGTALLNYAPAVAEAYYRKAPLIVISADRPAEWIDQDDSQTLRQRDALANFVKNSYDIPAIDTENMRWYADRQINDAILTAISGRPGPVHINIQIDEPIGALSETSGPESRLISMITPREDLPVKDIRELGCTIASPRKVMIIAGFMQPDSTLNKALNKLSRLPNFIVLTETIANLHGNDFISGIDATLSALSEEDKKTLAPDVVITLGGALVSRFVKQYLRTIRPLEHWHVGKSLTTIDCFKTLTLRVEIRPDVFFQQLASAMQPHTGECDFRRRWLAVRDASQSLHQSYVAKAPWSDLKAFATMMPIIPGNYNLQLSNGTPVRYAQLFTSHKVHRSDCNRGVSGIDGSTSTAIGATLAYNAAPTLLITGDMSAQYDIGALGSLPSIPPRFKMVVINNGGGGIFRFIKTTRDLDIVESCFEQPCRLPIRELAKAYEFSFFTADSEATLREEFKKFIEETQRPAIIEIITSGEISGTVLKDYFNDKIPMRQYD